MRAKGIVWCAERHDTVLSLSQAGSAVTLEPLARWVACLPMEQQQAILFLFVHELLLLNLMIHLIGMHHFLSVITWGDTEFFFEQGGKTARLRVTHTLCYFMDA